MWDCTPNPKEYARICCGILKQVQVWVYNVCSYDILIICSVAVLHCGHTVLIQSICRSHVTRGPKSGEVTGHRSWRRNPQRGRENAKLCLQLNLMSIFLCLMSLITAFSSIKKIYRKTGQLPCSLMKISSGHPWRRDKTKILSRQSQVTVVLGSPVPRLKKGWDWTGPRLPKTGNSQDCWRLQLWSGLRSLTISEI